MQRSYRCPDNEAIMTQPQNKYDSSFSGFYTRIFAVATALILGAACYRLLLPFITPLLWAILLTLALHPLHVRLTRWLRGRAQLSAILLTVLMLLALAGPVAAVGTAFVHQTRDLLQYLQGWVNPSGHDPFALADHPALATAMDWLTQNLGVTINDVRAWLNEATHASLSILATISGRLVLGALGTVVEMALTLFLMFFLIRDGMAMLNAVRDLVPMPEDKRQTLFAHLAAVTRAVMFGVGLTALLQGALIGVALSIVHAPSPVVLGVLAVLFALLPIGGTALIWVPATLILFAGQRWGAGIFMLVWGSMVAMIDNVVKPLLISGRASVATLTVFIGVLGGVTGFGTVGLFIGPVILALAIALIEFVLETQRQSRVSVVATPAHNQQTQDNQQTPSNPT